MLTLASSTTMSDFLTNIGLFFTQSLTWMGNLGSSITETPSLAVMCLGIPITGFIFGLLHRALHV